MGMYLISNVNLIDFNEESTKNCTLIIKDGRIEKVYYKKEHPPTGIPSIDLEGRFLLPSFTDSHTHLLGMGIERQRIDLGDCLSPIECLEKLSAHTHQEIIFGVNWDESKWRKGDKRDLNREVLDKISKEKPVIMRRVCGHFAIANSRALGFIPPDWRIVDRRKGLLYEDSALYLNKIFRPSIAMYEKGLEIAMEEALSCGVTSIHEITDSFGFEIYQRFKKKLNLRVAVYLQDEIDRAIAQGLKTNSGDEFLKFAGIKIFMDGSIGAKTAALKRPYRGTKNYGRLLISEDGLLEIIKKGEENSIQLMLHSIGDRSTDVSLNAFKKAGIKKNCLRHRLEHLELLTHSQLEKIARFALIASVQPNFIAWQFPCGLYEKNLGARYINLNRFKSLLNAGVRVVFGSDCMPIGPLKGICLCINHPNPEERLLPSQGFRLYTENPPFATFDEESKGKIAPGMFADFVILNKNPLIKENLKELKVLMVFVNGRKVYDIGKFREYK